MPDSCEYLLEPIRRGAEFTLCRARRAGNPAPLLVVTPTDEHPSSQSLRRLEHEYALADELESLWAAKPLALTRQDGRTILVLADPGGEPLDTLLDRETGQPLDVTRVLRVAINLAMAVGQAHERGLIHKDVRPENAIVDLAGNVRLVGFGMASRLAREHPDWAPPSGIAGTLAYMSPEQTGRMNRSIDTRSDLYSLGITLYRMLTGVLPFNASNALEWIHCHIARQPAAPRGPHVPEPLAAIVMRLLAKNAEERYQTATGLAADLRRCLAEWQSRGQIAPFALGANDRSDRLLIPEKLYGREREVEALIAAFDRVVAGGGPELLLVSGHSGIGKSVVVHELHQCLVPSRGLFAAGKFEQYKRDIPYATLAQAFQSLIRPLLTQPEAELSRWRDDLHDALSPNAALLVDLVPELKLVIGEQPPLAALPAREAKARSHLTFGRFIGVFTRGERPLALFLDDLQWLDAATLEFLEDLLIQKDLARLLVLGAYRDNEVDRTHPLMRALSAIRESGAAVHEIRLGPLSSSDLAGLIGDAFRCDAQRATPLAQLLHAKTAGNPFFSIQFIQALVDEGHIGFESVKAGWRWDLDALRSRAHTDNVIELMVTKLGRLPVATRTALQKFACLGHSASAATLSSVLELSDQETEAALRQALHRELITRSEDGYRFVHDRVQEAAYSLIVPDMRAEAHLRIGRLLSARTAPDMLEESVFEIVSQLNRGAHLIDSAHERTQVAQLNLMAARRAKAATAYGSALGYLASGRAVLPDDVWERHPELVFATECLMAECELLTADLGAAEVRLRMLALMARSAHDDSIVTRLRITLYTALDQGEVCVDVFLDYLRRGGTAWERHPSREEVLREYQRVWSLVGARRIEELVEQPPATNPDIADALNVFTEIVHPALFYDENLSSLVVCRMVTLSLEHGHCDASCFAYVWFAMLAGPRFDNYRDGFRFGQLGFDLVEKWGLVRYQARTYLTFATLTPWTRHFAAARELIRRGHDAAHRTGDLTYSAYSWKISITNALISGDALADVESEADKAVAFATKSRFGLMVTICGTQRGLIRTLRGATPVFGSFDDGDFDEARTESQLAGNPLMSLAEFFYWTRKLQARFFAGDLVTALAAAEMAQRLAWTATSQVTSADLPFYAALAHAAAWDAATPEERRRHVHALARHQRQLEVWSAHSPANFANRAALVAAEIARIDGRPVDAAALYETAIKSSRENGFVQNEGLANESAANHYLRLGLDTPAAAHFRNARDCYERWGALGKVRQLERRHPRLRDRQAGASQTIGAAALQLDIETVVTASQALSSEIALEKLVEKLVRLAVEHAGAERGLLILAREGEARIAAEATSSLGTLQVTVRQAAVTSSDLPEPLLRYVLRMRECVLLDDACADHTYSTDEYVRRKQPRSVLCLPVVKQSSLMGALYLENTLTAGAFTPERVTVLQLLAAQAAISLENAELYADLQLQAGLLRNLPVSVWTLQPDGTPDFVNPHWLQYSGQTLGFVRSNPEAWMSAVHPDDREAAARIFWSGVRSGEGFAIETRSLRASDGTYRRHVQQAVVLRDAEGRVLKFVGTTTDIEEQKRAEEALRQAQSDLARINRVTTMGELAASLAHEVSQPVSGAMTNANLCLRTLASPDPDLGAMRQAIARIARDTRRAADIIERVRSQFRKSTPKQDPVDVNDAVREVVGLLHDEALRHDIGVATELAADLPYIVGDRVQLQQVVMNLMVNSIEALKDVEGARRIVIRTTRSGREEIVVSIGDTGPGLPSQVAEKMFDPFFTTKPHGTGMGLRISRSIVEAHGGRLWALANAGAGVTFAFSIPGARVP